MAALIRVFDGRDGTPLPGALGQFLGLATSSLRVGAFVAAADVTGDGKADVIVGTDAGTRAQVRIYNGSNGTLLRTISPLGTSTGGARVAAADLDGDGLAEIIAASGRSATPLVKAFHAATGANLWSLTAAASSYRGGLFVSAGDVDGDGVADIMVGTGTGGVSTVRIYRGTDRQQLNQFTAFESTVTGGVRVALLDLDGDGRADPLTGTAPGVAPRLVLRSSPGMTVLATLNPFLSPIKGTFVAAGYTN
jgi:serralysin